MRPKIIESGKVEIDREGIVSVSEFEFSDASCREGAQLAIVWAIERLSVALNESLTADAPVLSGMD